MFDKKQMILVDIDTQIGFCLPEGHLYVKGAAEILENLRKITDFIDKESPKVVGSMDTHDYKCEEFAENGGPFPPHCVKGTVDWLKINQSLPKRFKIFGVGDVSPDEIEQYWADGAALYFEKPTYHIKDNPNFIRFLEKLKGATFVVYGVATDYCVKSAALFLKAWGDVMIIEDAVAAVAPETEEAAIAELNNAGIRFEKLSALFGSL